MREEHGLDLFYSTAHGAVRYHGHLFQFIIVVETINALEKPEVILRERSMLDVIVL